MTHYCEVVGYAYEADLHCETCTRKRFPEADEEFSDVEDSEGNPIHPMFAGDEHDPSGEYCGDCQCELWEPEEEIEEE